MEKIWLENYPAEVSREIDPETYRSVAEVLERTCERYADRPAFHNMGRTISFHELDVLSARFAAYLQCHLRLERGERVAIMMPNLLQYPVALFGIIRAGLVTVSVNPLYTARELRHQLRDSGAGTIVILENYAHVLQRIMGETGVRHVIVTGVGDMQNLPRRTVTNMVVRHVRKMVPAYRIPGAVQFRRALATGIAKDLVRHDIGPGDICFLQYTGGTTGVSKGAMLTHRNMVANMEQVSAWFSTRMERGTEVIVSPLPLYHIFCLSVNCLSYMKMGGLNVLITNPRDLSALVAELGKWRFSGMSGVNTLFNALLHNEEFRKLDFSALKLVVGGGMAVQKPVADRWFEVTGVPILEGYGLTETAPVVTANPQDITSFTGNIGLPVPSTKVSIRDDSGRELPPGEAGELCVRGPQVMKGYWRRPDETTRAFSPGGWFHTGDIAVISERGEIRIVDRKKDMILVSGFNVYPNEVEEVIAMHPAVLEVACIGVPDETSGEAVKAIVVPKPGEPLDEEAIRGHCRENLAAYKVPRVVEFAEALPKSTVGKVLRRELREAQPQSARRQSNP